MEYVRTFKIRQSGFSNPGKKDGDRLRYFKIRNRNPGVLAAALKMIEQTRSCSVNATPLVLIGRRTALDGFVIGLYLSGPAFTLMLSLLFALKRYS